MSSQMPARRPRIAVFSGPTATIQNALPLVTSNAARRKHGLPLLMDGDQQQTDVLRMQRLAAPVTVYVRQFSAHPLERDAAELYGPPDGYVDSRGHFHKESTGPDDVPVYEVTLSPEDGLYPLPYPALTKGGQPWEAAGLRPFAPPHESRQTFYPDASRIFEEIERMGGRIGRLADYDFIRALPAGGYANGLPEGERTDKGQGDIPPERIYEDYFPYPSAGLVSRPALARITNAVQQAMGAGDYDGGIWLTGTPDIADHVYWLNLLIDTRMPIVGNASQRARFNVSADGERNIMDSIAYIASGIWRGDDGGDALGAVLVQDQLIYSARDVEKADARPGGYSTTGGHGGIIGNMTGPSIAYIPNRRHTFNSGVRVTVLPDEVTGTRAADGAIRPLKVRIKDDEGQLLPGAIPMVTIVKAGPFYGDASGPQGPESEVEILARIEANLARYPLAGLVGEGLPGYGILPTSMDAALKRAVLHGMPVVKASLGSVGNFTLGGPQLGSDLFIGASNLTASKARLLLMAALMKFGSLPVPANPAAPTADELAAIRAKVADYQKLFNTH